MKDECLMICDCTYSSGCKREAAGVSSPHVSKGSTDQQTPEPAPRKRPQYPGIRQLALQQTADRREARIRRREAAIN